MSATNLITFRLPKRFHSLAEDYLVKNSEKSLNSLAQKLLISEIEKSEFTNHDAASKFDDESVQFLLAALGNSRELFLRVFEILFVSSNEKKLFEDVIEELQNDWLIINQKNAEEVLTEAAIETPEFKTDIEEIEFRLNQVFSNSATEKRSENFVNNSLSNATKKSSKRLTQTLLFE